MLGALGASALRVALGIAVLGLLAAAVGGAKGDERWIRAAYAAVYTQFALVAIATLSMVAALVTHDFSVSYVAQVGSRQTPLFYTVISLWGALEGSILFWGFVLASYTAASAARLQRASPFAPPNAAARSPSTAIPSATRSALEPRAPSIRALPP